MMRAAEMLYWRDESTRVGNAKTHGSRSPGTNDPACPFGARVHGRERCAPGKILRFESRWLGREEAQRQLEQISKEVLTNPVIEEYRFEIVD